jgi:hypothetical protein
MIVHEKDFPFEEIKDKHGDYFKSVGHAIKAGFNENQIWAVTEEDGTFIYGPNHHYINLVGYIATQEHHDGDTHYVEQH